MMFASPCLEQLCHHVESDPTMNSARVISSASASSLAHMSSSLELTRKRSAGMNITRMGVPAICAVVAARTSTLIAVAPRPRSWRAVSAMTARVAAVVVPVATYCVAHLTSSTAAIARMPTRAMAAIVLVRLALRRLGAPLVHMAARATIIAAPPTQATSNGPVR